MMSVAATWGADVAERVGRLARWMIDRTGSLRSRRAPLGQVPDEAEAHVREDALLEVLTRAHRLAEQLPCGKAEDEVRRSFGALIEATEAGTARDVRVRRVLSSIGTLRARRSTPPSAPSDHDAVSAFEAVVRGEVLPLLDASKQ